MSDESQSVEVAPLQTTEVIDPFSGEAVDLSNMADAGEFIELLRQAKERVQEAIRQAEQIVLDEMKRRGSGTVRVGHVEMKRRGGNEYEYDLTKLAELIDLGLPVERYDEVVKTEVVAKIDRRVIMSVAAANEAYADVIEAATTVTPKRQSVEVHVQSREKGNAS